MTDEQGGWKEVPFTPDMTEELKTLQAEGVAEEFTRPDGVKAWRLTKMGEGLAASMAGDHGDEICMECGESVAPGSGKYVDRLWCGDDLATRKEMGAPFPQGCYQCPQCQEEIEKEYPTQAGFEWGSISVSGVMQHDGVWSWVQVVTPPGETPVETYIRTGPDGTGLWECRGGDWKKQSPDSQGNFKELLLQDVFDTRGKSLMEVLSMIAKRLGAGISFTDGEGGQ